MALHVSTGGRLACGSDVMSFIAVARSLAATRAGPSPSPSALLTVMTSASSRMPRLMPCSWSPARANVTSRNVSTMPATATSDWPTPTVSTITTSYPPASTSSIDSRVARATPPRWPPLGDGLMNAWSLTASAAIRVRSPSIDPPVRVLDGSTASTATLWPASISFTPSASMSVDLPEPGTPVMPTRTALPVCERSSRNSSRERWWSSGRRDSTSVIARASSRRSPPRTPSTSRARFADTRPGPPSSSREGRSPPPG